MKAVGKTRRYQLTRKLLWKQKLSLVSQEKEMTKAILASLIRSFKILSSKLIYLLTLTA